jgi:hypothetical protein
VTELIASAAVGGMLLFFVWLCYWYFLGGGKTQRDLAKKQDDERERRTNAKGWAYTPVDSDAQRDGGPDHNIAYRIHGQCDGAEWEIHYDIDVFRKALKTGNPAFQSSYKRVAHSRLEFISQVPANGKFEWIIAGVNKIGFLEKLASNGLSAGLLKLSTLLTDELDNEKAFFQDARRLETGDAEWKQRFAISAQNHAYGKLIDKETQRLFMQWPAFETVLANNKQVVFVNGPMFLQFANTLASGNGKDNSLSTWLEDGCLRVQLICTDPSFAMIEQFVKLGQALLRKHREAVKK